MLFADDPTHTRPWEEIAADASHEKDPQRLMELTEELNRALDERDRKLRNSRKASAKAAASKD